MSCYRRRPRRTSDNEVTLYSLVTTLARTVGWARRRTTCRAIVVVLGEQVIMRLHCIVLSQLLRGLLGGLDDGLHVVLSSSS